MYIRHVTIEVPDPEQSARFFVDVLAAHSTDAENTIEIALGHSRLTLRQGDTTPQGYYHLAFDIPENTINEARDLLRARIDILPAGDGGTITAPAHWGAHSVYFNAPGNLNLELIGRHRVPNAINRPFVFTDIQNISEVGVPVDDPIADVRKLHTIFGLDPFNEPSDMFAPVGSDHGLIVLVKEGRIWFPTEDQQTPNRPLKIALGEVTGHLVLGEHCVVTGT